jgi:hypothetical protein
MPVRAASCAIAGFLGWGISAFAQPSAPYQPSLTPDGRPDFQGVWSTRWTTPLERPQNLKSLVISTEEGAGLHQAVLKRLDSVDPLGTTYAWDFTGPLTIGGEARSSLIIDPADGLLPYTEEGRARRNRFVTPFSGDEGPEQRAFNERCLMAGSGYAPFLSVPVGNLRQIVQTPDAILFHTEGFNQLRIIPVDGRSGPAIPRGGSSSGRWDRDTLVVETTDFLDSDRIRFAPGSVFPISPATRITERFTLIGRDEMLYRFTISDAALYTQPWTAESLLTRTDDRMFEFACHEGNYALSGILAGARAVEQRTSKIVPDRAP